jgi:hypothetical protein
MLNQFEKKLKKDLNNYWLIFLLNIFFPEIRCEEEWVVRKGRFGRIQQDIYCVYDDYFYAYRINPDNSPDNSLDKNLFSHFIIMTKFGIGTYGMKPINSIHFSLTFQNLNSKGPQIEITSVTPTKEIKAVGYIYHMSKTTSDKGGGVAGGLNVNAEHSLLQTSLNLRGSIQKRTENEFIGIQLLPNEIDISNPIIGGKNANWIFNAASTYGAQGTYPINIYFKIKNFVSTMKNKKNIYHAIPEIVVNNDIELNVQRRDGNAPTPIPIEFIV